MDSELHILGNRIRNLREDNDLTQKELSSMIGLTPKMISFYENNQRTPPVDVLIKLAKIFNVTVDYLIGFSKSNNGMNLSGQEINLVKYFRTITSHPKQKDSLYTIEKFFPGATFLSDEEHELLQYYNELSKKDRRWIMGQMIDLIKKADEKDMEIPKAQ